MLLLLLLSVTAADGDLLLLLLSVTAADVDADLLQLLSVTAAAAVTAGCDCC